MKTMQSEKCFICGKSNPKGIKLAFEAGEGISNAEWIVEKDYIGYANILHGGILMAIIDETMVYAAQSLGLDCVTAQIEVKFKKPIFVGQRLIFEGCAVAKSKGKKIHTRCRVFCDGVIVADANGIIITVDPGVFGKKE